MLDIVAGPDFATTGYVYVSFTESRSGGKNGTTAARLRLAGTGDGGGLRDPWGNNYMLYYVSRNAANGNGAIMLFSKGPNGTMNTSTNNIRSGIATGDDMVTVVTRAL